MATVWTITEKLAGSQSYEYENITEILSYNDSAYNYNGQLTTVWTNQNKS